MKAGGQEKWRFEKGLGTGSGIGSHLGTNFQGFITRHLWRVVKDAHRHRLKNPEWALWLITTCAHAIPILWNLGNQVEFCVDASLAEAPGASQAN